MHETFQALNRLMQSQEQRRFLRLHFPHQDAPAARFAVHQIEAEESLSRDFSFKVELLSDEPGLSLKEMQGKLLNVAMVRSDGSLRYFSGYVFGFRRLHSDGALTLYEAWLGPWLKFLALRKDNYLFHGKTLREQSESIFSDYSFYPRWAWQVSGEDPPMTDACQFNETDFNYLCRRWEAAGWHYFYRHDEQGHTLVVASDSSRCLAIDCGPEVRFHDQGGANEEDGIHRWACAREMMPASVALSSFNFKDPRPVWRDAPTLNQQGCVPHVESYEYAGAYGFRNADAGYEMAKLRMEEVEAIAKFYQGEGNCRYIEPGRYFRLVDHFNHGPHGRSDATGKDDFLILSVKHKAVNNVLQRESSERPRYEQWLTCTRRSIPWRPGRQFNSEDTRILAPQTATVVGPSGPDSIHTDEYGRVRVQFHWDRIGSNDDRSSAWIRVAGPWAGAELGSAAIPRVGSEVVVHWLSGDPDRPIILAAVANRWNMPPWTLPEQRALSGLRSRELAPGTGNAPGGRGNHLILDDTTEQLQVQLKSDHQCSQLSLGHLVRIERTQGREEARGEGWELATNAWGVARAGRGMLITTEARRNAGGPAKDLGETAQRLSLAQQALERHADFAEQCGALVSGEWSDMAAALHKQNNAISGKGSVAGSAAFPEFVTPQLVLASPVGIAASTDGSTHLSSTEHTVVSTGGSVAVTAGNSFFASVRNSLRLMVHRAGMKLIAAAGNIDMQALSDSIHLLAKLKITQTAGQITITAKEEILINGGGSYARFSGDGVEFGTSGDFIVHAANHEFTSPKSMNAQLVIPAQGGFDNAGAFLFSA